MIIIRTLYTQNKNLLTSPIRSLVRNGERNADVITIVTDRFYEDYDLSLFGFVMEGVNANGGLSLQNLKFEVKDEQLSIFWTVTSDFTAVSGPMTLKLKAVSADEDVCIVFDGGEIEITGISSEDFLPASTGEQIVLQLEQAIAEYEGNISNLAEEKVSEAVSEYDFQEKVTEALPDNVIISESVDRIVKITQADFDALEEKDETVLYLIV